MLYIFDLDLIANTQVSAHRWFASFLTTHTEREPLGHKRKNTNLGFFLTSPTSVNKCLYTLQLSNTKATQNSTLINTDK